MPISAVPAVLTNWSRSERSSCSVFRPRDSAEILEVFSAARLHKQSVVARGAGHSYTDAALNTHEVVIDTANMCRILSWDPESGIIQVEPGVTLREVIRVVLPDGWWLPVTPSTAEVTVGGCVAMNITGKNAWKCGSFGEHVVSLRVLLTSGEALDLSPASTPELFHAFVGSAGLLGVYISITLQLQRIASGFAEIMIRPAPSLSENIAIFKEEHSADHLEGLIDGFDQMGRGIVTCTRYSAVSDRASLRFSVSRLPDQMTTRLARYAGTIFRPAVNLGMRVANSSMYEWNKRWSGGKMRWLPLFKSSFFPDAAFAGYQAILPYGMQSLHVFVPSSHAEEVFQEILRRSRHHNFVPLWCVIKQQRPDPFLLSYQVEGFSLETYYRVIPQQLQALQKMLLELMELVITAGGRFYLAKDGLLTSSLYRWSIGDAPVDAFLMLKRQYDPTMLLQSNLFRRVFQEP